ncbi:MAG: glycoside hydrolase family 13 protein [Velocimicrobium sp.]
MNREAISHENTVRFVYAKSRECLTFCIRVGRKDIKECELIYYARTNPEEKKKIQMQWKYRDMLYDYFEVDVFFSKIARYQKYYFYLKDYNEMAEYLTVYGLSKREPEDGLFEYLYTNEGDVIEVPKWSKGQIFYQIFPERFCNGNKENDPLGCVPWGSIPTRENFMGGDLIGILNHLDYLEALGVQCIYLNPIFKGDFNHKYATTDYFEIAPEFGTKEEFSKLINDCHKKNIKVILDGVFNHTGINFEPFLDILEKQETSIYKDWFYITEYPVNVSHHNYECVGAYKWMPKLNTSNNDVMEYIVNVMEYWIKEFHIDGWRLDVADEVDGRVWQEAKIRLKEKYPNILLLGETWGYGLGMMLGNQLDSVMNYVFRDMARDFFAFECIGVNELDHRINQMLGAYFSEAKHSLYNLLDSHDTERFLFFCGEDKRKLKLAVAFQFMFLGSPAIYYGDEVGITGGTDPYCRKAMVWEEDKQDKELLQWYQRLAKIREQEICIRSGEYVTNLCEEESNVFGFIRYNKEDAVYTLINRSENKTTVVLPVLRKGIYQDLMNGETTTSDEIVIGETFYNGDVLAYKGKVKVALEPYAMKVIKQI